jgi:hypothetical protein
MAASSQVLVFSLAKHLANGRIIYRFSRASVPVHHSTDRISFAGWGN